MTANWNTVALRSTSAAALIALATLLLSPAAMGAQGSAKQTDNQVTFTRDIAPILQNSCQTCHRPGSVAPMSLLTYENVRPWAAAIKAKVANRSMPPWTIDRTVGIQKFKDDRSLSDEDIATIVKWVDSGAPGGNPADMPPPRQFGDVAKWTIGVPEYVISIPPFKVPSTGANMWIDMIVDSGLTEDRWIKAYETKPSVDGFAVVHHVTTFVARDDGEEEMLSEYALGKTGDIHPDGTARLIKAGTKIRFNLHYSPNGKETTDQTSLGLTFYPKGYVPKHIITRASVGGVQDLDIPPGERDVRVDGYQVLHDNIRMTVFQPHLHSRGKRQCLEAIYPNNRVETLNCVNWDFGWHIAYNYQDDMQPLLPKGTVLHVITWHDNSTANKWNPDPLNWAGYGQRSSDDMAFAHLSWYTLTDQEYKDAVTARLTLLRQAINATAQQQ